MESVNKNYKSLLTEATVLSHDICTLPPEIEAGNVEYKLKLVNPSRERLQHLVTQMKWRLAEGQGEAIYELGVSDHGILIGMTQHELDLSLDTLRSMANELGAELSVVRERSICGRARSISKEVRLRRDQLKQASYSKPRPLGGASDSGSVSTLGDEDYANFTLAEFSSDSASSATVHYSTDEYKVAEVLIRKTNSADQFIEIRIAFLGGTAAGKSTLLGYLSHGEADNGRGKARLNLLRHRHEIESGRSSSISHSIIGFSSTGQLLNYASTHHHLGVSASPVPLDEDYSSSSGLSDIDSGHHHVGRGGSTNLIDAYIVDKAAKIAMLIDTCGLPKYINTTLSSLTGYQPDYACLVVDGNAGGVDGTTKELLGCAMVLTVPVFVVVTKIDLCQESEAGKVKLKATMESLIHLLMLPGSSRLPVVIQKEDDAIVSVQPFIKGSAVPIFLVSNVSSENMDLITKFINLLPSRGACVRERKEDELDRRSERVEFHIEEVYHVADVGTVVGGRLLSGSFQRDIHWIPTGSPAGLPTKSIWLGPLDSESGNFRKVQVSSVHRQRRPVSAVLAGQTASIALEGVEKDQIRKGMVLLGQSEPPKACWEFEADMMILYAPSGKVRIAVYDGKVSMGNGRKPSNSRKRKNSSTFAPSEIVETDRYVYRGITHVGNARQPVYILGVVPNDRTKIENDLVVVSSGSRVRLRLRFSRAAEWIRDGMRLLYRDHEHRDSKTIKESSSPMKTQRTRGIKMVGEVTKVIENLGIGEESH